MIVSAMVSFVGKTSMAKDEKKDISDKAVLSDLINAGYVVPEKAEDSAKPAEKQTKKSTKKES